jgi:hypothetical protein
LIIALGSLNRAAAAATFPLRSALAQLMITRMSAVLAGSPVGAGAGIDVSPPGSSPRDPCAGPFLAA